MKSFFKVAHLLSVTLIQFVYSEDDFRFEQLKHQPLQRLWGIPDTTAQIGYLFHFEIPKNAFYGNVARFKAYTDNGSPLPNWLTFHEKLGVMEGIPTEEDLGEHYIMVKAFDDDLNDFVKDIFALEVLSKPDYRHKSLNNCKQHGEKIILSVICDANYKTLSPARRMDLIKSFLSFSNLSHETIHLSNVKENDKILNYDIINAGPGNTKKIKYPSSTSINFQIGCQQTVWKKYLNIVDEIARSSKNGSLAKAINEPVIGWKIWKETAERNNYKTKREVPNLLQLDGNEELENSEPDPRIVVLNTVTPLFTPDPSPTVNFESTTRHHRHNHGLHIPSHQVYSTSSSNNIEITSTPTYIPDRPSSLTPVLYLEDTSPAISLDNSRSVDPTLEPDTSNSIKETPETEDIFGSSGPTPPLYNSTSPFTEESTPQSPRNTPPIIFRRLQKIATPAGKVFRRKIPLDTFHDEEDGDSESLKVRLRTNGSELPSDYWIQFDDSNQEIYALPLEDRTSKWNFDLIAFDSGGLSVHDDIEFRVQDNKGRRTVNHAIKIDLLSVPPGVSLDWQLKLLDIIREKFHDPDTSNITVLNVSTTEPHSFTWTNDSLPRNECPLNDINHLYKTLSGDNGIMNSDVAPGLRVGNISWTGKGLCESKPPDLSTKNFPPTIINQVDYLNATVGQLLVFTVPKDTFYDPEDGETPRLKLSLETKDSKEISSNNWLQFDVKKQQFYGIPMSTDVGQNEYLLTCKDTEGLTARDGLVVAVHSTPRVMYNVEFSMKLALDYSKFKESPLLQRIFIENLANLFGDINTNAIVLSGISPGSTVITWHNKTLPTNICPDNKIKQLRQIILGDDERITDEVTKKMGKEFSVMSARLTPTGLCQGALTEVSAGGVETTNNGVTVSRKEHYVIGLIVPAFVITVMLLCAGVVACILYRRRRTGKMSVGDEDERQTFRNKGIPVIFQDELDERPEPTNKSPVIMKEEKPPLPPPEYQRGPPLATTALLSDTEDSPYQPPPPFTTSRDSARPKPTPTYRMPPPYVPP